MRFLIFLLWLLHFLPLPVLGRIGNAVGWLMYYAIPKRRKIALINLRLCMPELSEAERVDIAKRHFMAYSRSILERSLIWWAPFERIHGLIDVVPAVPKAQMESGPTILFCPHFVCLDVGGVAARVMPLATIYAPQKNKAFDDLLRYGMIPELVGRLPVTVALDALDEKSLVRILKEPKNALTKQYTKLFGLEEVKITFDEGALTAIATKALKRGTGARGLRAILEEVLMDVMFDLPSREDVVEVKVTESCITNGTQPLLEISPVRRKKEA